MSCDDDRKYDYRNYPFAAELCATTECLAEVPMKVTSFDYGPGIQSNDYIVHGVVLVNVI